MKQQFMSNIYNKEYAELYDGIVQNYFDYEKSVQGLAGILKDNNIAGNVLELGVGTGNLAIPLAEKYPVNIFGIDTSRDMLKIAKEKSKFKNYCKNKPKFMHSSADDFVLDNFWDSKTNIHTFQAIYSHSGPIITYEYNGKIGFVADSVDSFKKIINNTKRNLDIGGLLLINIEEPISKEYLPSKNEKYVKEVFQFDNVFHRKYTYFLNDKKLGEFELKSPVIKENEMISKLIMCGFEKFTLDFLNKWFYAIK